MERALEAGWASIGAGALEAVTAAVRWMEDEPLLNAGMGAVLSRDGDVELDAGIMLGSTLAAGACGAVRDVRHPVELARAVMECGEPVLLVGEGASRFARARGLEICANRDLVTAARRSRRPAEMDTVGAVARDAGGGLAVAVSTGGVSGKLPGRLGDSPVPGAGFYADDSMGAACATGRGEGFMRTVLCHLAVLDSGRGTPAQASAEAAIAALERRVAGSGGIIVIDSAGGTGCAHNTPYMAWAQRAG